MSIQDAEKFTEEIRRYTEARRAARKVRNMVANLNMALATAAQHGVTYDLKLEEQEVPVKYRDCESKGLEPYIHVTLRCMQVLEANEPADWVLNRFREAAAEIATGSPDTAADLRAKVQHLVDYIDGEDAHADDRFTFPDGDSWEPTRVQEQRRSEDG